MVIILEHIKGVKTIRQLANDCVLHAEVLNVVVDALNDSNYTIAYNASWVLAHCFTDHPELYQSRFTPILLTSAKAFTNKSGIQRNVLKIFQTVELHSTEIDDVLELAINTLENIGAEAALRAFSITVLERYIHLYPELILDTIFLIERELPNAGAAFTVRAKLFLKRYAQNLA